MNIFTIGEAVASFPFMNHLLANVFRFGAAVRSLIAAGMTDDSAGSRGEIEFRNELPSRVFPGLIH